MRNALAEYAGGYSDYADEKARRFAPPPPPLPEPIKGKSSQKMKAPARR
jgi:hypothetical protein